MKKFIKALVAVILVIIIAFSAYTFISGRTYLFEAVWYNFANIDDYKKFSNNPVVTGEPQPWNISGDYNKNPLPADLKKMLEDLETVAVLGIRNDSILYEFYWDGYSDSSLSSSFSMAKSITSLLVGAALKEGKIKSLGAVGNYLAEFRTGERAN